MTNVGNGISERPLLALLCALARDPLLRLTADAVLSTPHGVTVTKRELREALDAVVAHLYGLSEKHLIHIFETFHEGWGLGTTANHPTLGDYDKRFKGTLGHFQTWTARVGSILR